MLKHTLQKLARHAAAERRVLPERRRGIGHGCDGFATPLNIIVPTPVFCSPLVLLALEVFPTT